MMIQPVCQVLSPPAHMRTAALTRTILFIHKVLQLGCLLVATVPSGHSRVPAIFLLLLIVFLIFVLGAVEKPGRLILRGPCNQCVRKVGYV